MVVAPTCTVARYGSLRPELATSFEMYIEPTSVLMLV